MRDSQSFERRSRATTVEIVQERCVQNRDSLRQDNGQSLLEIGRFNEILQEASSVTLINLKQAWGIIFVLTLEAT